MSQESEESVDSYDSADEIDNGVPGACGAGVGWASKSITELVEESDTDSVSETGTGGIETFSNADVSDGSRATRIILGADSDGRETIRYDLRAGGVVSAARGRRRIYDGVSVFTKLDTRIRLGSDDDMIWETRTG